MTVNLTLSVRHSESVNAVSKREKNTFFLPSFVFSERKSETECSKAFSFGKMKEKKPFYKQFETFSV
jgi:hypothetical protein